MAVRVNAIVFYIWSTVHASVKYALYMFVNHPSGRKVERKHAYPYLFLSKIHSEFNRS